ncbi:unnamed protein product, partial [Arabidopsis halleri]
MCIDPGRAAPGVAHAHFSQQYRLCSMIYIFCYGEIFVCVLLQCNQITFRIMVTGYDTSLPELDIQIGLCKHFSTCGEVTVVLIPGDRRTGGLN